MLQANKSTCSIVLPETVSSECLRVPEKRFNMFRNAFILFLCELPPKPFCLLEKSQIPGTSSSPPPYCGSYKLLIRKQKWLRVTRVPQRDGERQSDSGHPAAIFLLLALHEVRRDIVWSCLQQRWLWKPTWLSPASHPCSLLLPSAVGSKQRSWCSP